MSLVYITQHNENIYNLDKFDRAAVDEQFTLQILKNSSRYRYVSKYHNNVIKKTYDVINTGTYSKVVAPKPGGISDHKTMGYAQHPLRNTCDYLRKHEGITWKRQKEHICRKILNLIPPIPKASELPKKIPKVEKNMIKINIENNKNLTIKQPKPKFAFTCRGDTRELCNSGSMPAYIFSPTFGRLPNYLVKNSKILCDKKKLCEEYEQKVQRNDDNFYMLDPEERIQVIKGLKQNWIEKQLKFQRLPAVVECSGIKHRHKLEEDLRQLEEDIVLLEYNTRIYICN